MVKLLYDRTLNKQTAGQLRQQNEFDRAPSLTWAD